MASIGRTRCLPHRRTKAGDPSWPLWKSKVLTGVRSVALILGAGAGSRWVIRSYWTTLPFASPSEETAVEPGKTAEDATAICGGGAEGCVEETAVREGLPGDWVESFLRGAPVPGQDEVARLRRALLRLAS